MVKVILHMDTNPKERLRYLDALRGLAALWIAIFHMTYQAFSFTPTYSPPTWLINYVQDGGDGGVAIFLIISGFSLCYTMTGHQQESKPLLKFYLRRFFRIAPLFYVLIIYKLFEDKLVLNSTHGIYEIALNIFFIFNIIPGKHQGIVGAGWVIGVLSLFYLFFPLFYKYFNDTLKTATFVIWSILMAYLFSFLLHFFPAATNTFFPFFRWSFLNNLPLFTFGMFSFYLLQTPLLRNHNIKVIGIFLVGSALFLYIEFVNERLNIFYPLYMRGFILSVLLVGLAENPLKIVTNRITTFLGKISYSLYLCHPPVILMLRPVYEYIYMQQMGISLKYMTISCITILVAVGVSFIVYQLIEKPGMVLGKKVLNSIK